MRLKNTWLLFLILAFLSSGCSKKSDNPVGPDNSPSAVLNNSGSIVLDGGSFSNQTFELTSGLSGFASSTNTTSCVLYGKDAADSIAVILTFPGKGTGNFDWQGYQDTGTETYYDGCTVTFYGNSINMYLVDNGKTNVTVFGDVGKTIEGTFSGKLQSMDGSQSMSVNGSFKCLRVQDE